MCFIPKQVSLRESIVIFPTVGYFAWIAHTLVGLMADLLDFGPTKDIEFADWALITFVPSLMAILYLNLMKTDKALLYALVWTIVSLLIELLLVQVGFMKYKGWNIEYSALFYVIAYLLLLPWYYKATVKVGV
jgi:hypothetical protein